VKIENHAIDLQSAAARAQLFSNGKIETTQQRGAGMQLK
jgi:hypothetical protein